jgi:hypothetical protein
MRRVTADARVDGLPGSELVEAGIADLAAGRESVEALLVASARERLAEVGHAVPPIEPGDLAVRLYASIEASVGDAHAHARYNALRRRLLSFARAARTDADATTAGR